MVIKITIDTEQVVRPTRGKIIYPPKELIKKQKSILKKLDDKILDSTKERRSFIETES